MTESCGNCKWWEKDFGRDGVCRRRSPGRVKQTHADERDGSCLFIAVWPQTNGVSDFCGDFEASSANLPGVGMVNRGGITGAD